MEQLAANKLQLSHAKGLVMALLPQSAPQRAAGRVSKIIESTTARLLGCFPELSVLQGLPPWPPLERQTYVEQCARFLRLQHNS